MKLDHATFNEREAMLYRAGLLAFKHMKGWRSLFYLALTGNVVQLAVSWWCK